ncbi:MAG: DUF1848 domain-containing protein [Treponema sp.]|nr:DUF1848 domain-containing protein [Treponema sp.]
MIISVSRRCDIPRFAFGWFLERLDAGFVDVKNPFNPRQVRRVPLLPCEGSVFAFWTREPASILSHAEDLERRGYNFYVMTTLTAYPSVLEPNVPAAAAVIQAMKGLAQKITPQRVIWRYDPVFLSSLTDSEFHRRNFAHLAAQLNGAVKRVIVSVYDRYSAAERRLAALERSGVLERSPHNGAALDPACRQLLAELSHIARSQGMEIQSCAEEGMAELGIPAGACIDGEYIARLFGLNAPGRDKGQGRPLCRCAPSVDIGAYGNCPAGCVYCYGLWKSAGSVQCV